MISFNLNIMISFVTGVVKTFCRISQQTGKMYGTLSKTLGYPKTLYKQKQKRKFVSAFKITVLKSTTPTSGLLFYILPSS